MRGHGGRGGKGGGGWGLWGMGREGAGLYLSNLFKVFVQIFQCICPNYEKYLCKRVDYLSRLTKVFVQWWGLVDEQETQGGGCCVSALHLSNF